MPPFVVLVVCTGNICRSPAAELLLRGALAQRLGTGAPQIVVRSAGVGCDDGWPVDPPVGLLLDAEGTSGWRDLRSTSLTDDLIDGADLVLTATRSHRLRIGERWPAAYSRTFTLGEAAHLLPSVAVPGGLEVTARARAVTDWLADERSTRQVPSGLDLADPHGGRQADYADMMARLRPMVTVVAEALAPQMVVDA